MTARVQPDGRQDQNAHDVHRALAVEALGGLEGQVGQVDRVDAADQPQMPPMKGMFPTIRIGAQKVDMTQACCM